MKSEYNLALIGELNGAVETTLEVLVKRNFPVANIFPLVKSEEEIDSVMFSGKPVDASVIDDFDWQQVDIAFFLTDQQTTLQWADIASEYCIVIDNSGALAQDHNVPLVQVDINEQEIGRYIESNKIAVAGSETAQLTQAIKQLHQEVGLVRVNICSYHAASAAGKEGVTTLAGETARLLNAKGIESTIFPQQVAFNVFPQVGELNDQGIAFSELRLINEVRRLLNDPSIMVACTQAIVPIFYGCAQAVHLQTHYPVDLEEVAQSLHHSEGVVLAESVCHYPNIIDEVIGNEQVHVGRLRQDVCDACGINMWVCADNVYFGIATNVVKVAEKLIATFI